MNKKQKIKLIIAGLIFLFVVIVTLVVVKKLLTKNELDSTVYQVKKETYEKCI